MSENLAQLKLAEKLEAHFKNLGYDQFLAENDISEIQDEGTLPNMIRASNDPKITKADILPMLNNPKASKIFEFLSRNVQTKNTTETLRSQLKAFEQNSLVKVIKV